MEFSRQEDWSGWPSPSRGDLSNPGIKPGSPTLQADSLPSGTREALHCQDQEKESQSGIRFHRRAQGTSLVDLSKPLFPMFPLLSLKFPFFYLSLSPWLEPASPQEHTSCQSAHPSPWTSTSACHGKWRTCERYHGKKKFSKRRPQTTNTGRTWSPLFTKLKNFITYSIGGQGRVFLASVGLRVDCTGLWIQEK